MLMNAVLNSIMYVASIQFFFDFILFAIKPALKHVKYYIILCFLLSAYCHTVLLNVFFFFFILFSEESIFISLILCCNPR